MGIFHFSLSGIIIFFLILGGASAQQGATSTNSFTKDLATQAAAEKLPQVSASILRTQLQQEKNPEERQKLTLRLGEILVSEHRPEEALVVLDSKDLTPDAMIS